MADEELETIREVIHEPLNRIHQFDNGAVITGCIVIAEWSDTEGTKWITNNAVDINGEVPPEWTVEGWLRHVLRRGQVNCISEEDETD